MDVAVRISRGLSILVVTLLLAACALLDPPAARRLDLTGTSWSVVEIDGQPPVNQEEAALAFPDLNRVMLSTDCGDLTADLYVDIDGSGLIISSEFLGSTNPCSADAEQKRDQILQAVLLTACSRQVEAGAQSS
jgi:heat shock protein HslJ